MLPHSGVHPGHDTMHDAPHLLGLVVLDPRGLARPQPRLDPPRLPHDGGLPLRRVADVDPAAGAPLPVRHTFTGTCSAVCRNGYGIELPHTAVIGRRLVIEHQHGIVVHGAVRMGDDCILRQGVTLGNKSLEKPHDAPRLGDRRERRRGGQNPGSGHDRRRGADRGQRGGGQGRAGRVDRRWRAGQGNLGRDGEAADDLRSSIDNRKFSIVNVSIVRWLIGSWH